MKKNVIYIAIILVLVTVAVIFYVKDEKSTLMPGSSDFVLEDIQQVDSIFLQQDSLQLTLNRKKDQWFINHTIPVRKPAISNFFNVLTSLRVEAPCRKETREEVLDLIHQSPVEVKIYDKGHTIKHYLVEDSKYKKEITYMMMQNGSTPFIMNLPGYQGDIAKLYRLDLSYWRDKTFFSYSPIDIKRIEMHYPAESKVSFRLTYNTEKFTLVNTDSDKALPTLSSAKASRFFSYFSDVRYERLIARSSLQDSLKNQQPFCTIKVADTKGREVTLRTYRKASGGETDAFGQQSEYDLNHLYGLYSEYEEILLIKYTEIDPLFKEIDYFRVD